MSDNPTVETRKLNEMSFTEGWASMGRTCLKAGVPDSPMMINGYRHQGRKVTIAGIVKDLEKLPFEDLGRIAFLTMILAWKPPRSKRPKSANPA